MDEKDFLNKMENLKKPEINADQAGRQFKLTLLSASKSAMWGTWFLVVPVFFFCCVAIKYLLKWDWEVAGKFLDWMAYMDRSMAFPIVSVVLFILLPGIGVIVNLLAIVHFIYDKTLKEITVTIKLKWLNIILAIISAAIIGVVLLYAISENSAERAIHRMERKEQLKSY